MAPFFSIIIPVYNVAPYLRECLDSVLAQTFTDWEAICVDDGSTDNSGAILDEYAIMDLRFKVIHKVNAGVSVARNVALDRAKGLWVGFLDADDVLKESWLKEVFFAVEDGIDWVRTGWTDWRLGKFQPIDAQPEFSQRKISGQGVIKVGWDAVSRCSYPVINFYKRDSIGEVRFSSGVRFREDALFLYEMCLAVKGMKIISSVGYLRRVRSGSATYSKRRRDDTINLLDRYMEIWMKLRSYELSSEKCIVESSTQWVAKDVKEWFVLCSDRSFADSIKVWWRVVRLKAIGAVGWNLRGSRLDGLRWKMFLVTGISRVLRMSLRNPLGKIRHV